MSLPEDWPLRRIRTLRRDGYQCQLRHTGGPKCLAPASLIAELQPGDHSLDNLEARCTLHRAD